MAAYSYSIALRIRHPSKDLGGIGAALGIAPGRVWKAGEPRTNPKGNPLKGVHPESYWWAPLLEGQSVETALPDGLRRTVENLRLHKPLFLEIGSTGGRMEISIDWCFPDGGNGDVIPHAILGELAELHLDLSVATYLVPQNSQGPTDW
jgi:hypothetical protein